MPLTDIKLRGIKPGEKPVKLSDGGQLYLLVNPNGSKLWRMDYQFEGKRKTLSFGRYPTVTLAAARALRDRAKKALNFGFDPTNHENLDLTDHDSFELAANGWQHRKRTGHRNMPRKCSASSSAMCFQLSDRSLLTGSRRKKF
uniref:Arm DNA-binding domain-containing protein n=1 Tax=Yoonia sp. TaxID=2212373 RepID=UPI0040485D6E